MMGDAWKHVDPDPIVHRHVVPGDLLNPAVIGLSQQAHVGSRSHVQLELHPDGSVTWVKAYVIPSEGDR